MTSSGHKPQYHVESVIRHQITTSDGPWLLETPLDTRYINAGYKLLSLVEDCNIPLPGGSANPQSCSGERPVIDHHDPATTNSSTSDHPEPHLENNIFGTFTGTEDSSIQISAPLSKEGADSSLRVYPPPPGSNGLKKRPFEATKAVIDERRIVIRRNSTNSYRSNDSDKSCELPTHEALSDSEHGCFRDLSLGSRDKSDKTCDVGQSNDRLAPSKTDNSEGFSDLEKQQVSRYIQLGRGPEEVINEFENYSNDMARFKILYNDIKRKSEGPNKARMEFSPAEIQILQDHINRGGNWPSIRNIFPKNQDSYRSKFYSLLKQTRRARS